MIGKRRHLHDFFWCPHGEKTWHERIPALREEMEGTSSQKLKKLLQSEIDELLRKARRK